MSFFSHADSPSFVIIEIGASSIGVGYVGIAKDGIRSLLYAFRIPLEPRPEERSTDTLGRSLGIALETLSTQGSPVLRKKTGSGSVGRVVISVDTPWQDTHIETHTLTFEKPRTISAGLLENTIREKTTLKEGCEMIDEVILSVHLNGYEIPTPFGKQASRVEFNVLQSFLPKDLHEVIHALVRKTFHTNDLSLVSFAPVAFVALRDMYPFEKDFLVVTVGDLMTDAAQARAGVLVATSSVPHGIDSLLEAGREAGRVSEGAGEDAESLDTLTSPERNAAFGSQTHALEAVWRNGVHEMLHDFAKKVFLPKTVFLIAENAARDYIARTLFLDTTKTLWLSQEGPTVIPLTADVFSSYLHVEPGINDIALFMLALYDGKRLTSEAHMT